jgi:ABC-type amino acid transport substrate-binding protein
MSIKRLFALTTFFIVGGWATALDTTEQDFFDEIIEQESDSEDSDYEAVDDPEIQEDAEIFDESETTSETKICSDVKTTREPESGSKSKIKAEQDTHNAHSSQTSDTVNSSQRAEIARLVQIPPELLDAAPDIMEILHRAKLRVGICPIDQFPFHIKAEDGTLSGFDIDLARGIANALQVQLEIVEVPDWEQTITYLLERKIDLIISNLTATPERASKIFCSTPYAKIRQCMLLNRVLLARAASKDLRSLRQIFSEYENRSLLVQEGTSYVSFASTIFPKAHVIATPHWEDIMSRILSKEILGTVSDELEIKQQIQKVQAMELFPVVIKKKFDQIVVGVSRDSPQLLHFVNNYISTNNIECSIEDY